jgi:hypothetical protein
VKDMNIKKYDVVILGGGLAGIYTALNLNKDLKIAILIKDLIDRGSSNLAQGGIAAEVEFDPDRIESSLKLGRLSSWFGRGNSREYNRLMETYRQFNDPRHKNFLNEDLLREAAVNYRDRKANQGHTGQGNSLDDRRMKFADDIIATCDQCKAEQSQIFKNIDSEFFTDYPPKKEPFLSSEDVEEKEYEYNVDEKELNKEIDFSKNIDEIAIK